jgi:hypothetical protein
MRILVPTNIFVLPTSNILFLLKKVTKYGIVTINGVTVLIDPILDGPLDFGIPALYKAKKRVMASHGLLQKLPPIDGILITQGYLILLYSEELIFLSTKSSSSCNISVDESG